MNLLSLAVNAPLPLVSVETDDTMNIMKVLRAELGTKVERVPEIEKQHPVQKDKRVKELSFALCKKNTIYCLRDGDTAKYDWPSLYNKFAELQSSLIVVNPSDPMPEVFPTGFVSCPQSLIEEFAKKLAVPGSDEFNEIVSALSGLSYQNMARMGMLAQAHAGHVSGAALREVRRSFFGTVRGLIQENAEVPFYVPNQKLEDWLAVEGRLFSEDAPFVLRPRGLLFDGPPGTGKTMGAKYVAREMGLPLYRLDIGSTMGKYVGESEKGLDAALAQADRCAPCVMLLDEIEKVFGGMTGGDSGVSTRALSKLLWWLQEHQSLVLPVMTTNNAKALPPELIREGRIDATMVFPALGKQHGWAFMESLAEKYRDIADIPTDELDAAHEAQFKEEATTLSHAHLTGVVMKLIKHQYLNPSKKTPAKKATKSKTPKSGA